MNASHYFFFGDNFCAALATWVIDFGIEFFLGDEVTVSFLDNFVFGFQ